MAGTDSPLPWICLGIEHDKSLETRKQSQNARFVDENKEIVNGTKMINRKEMIKYAAMLPASS